MKIVAILMWQKLPHVSILIKLLMTTLENPCAGRAECLLPK